MPWRVFTNRVIISKYFFAVSMLNNLKWIGIPFQSMPCTASHFRRTTFPTKKGVYGTSKFKHFISSNYQIFYWTQWLKKISNLIKLCILFAEAWQLTLTRLEIILKLFNIFEKFFFLKLQFLIETLLGYFKK